VNLLWKISKETGHEISAIQASTSSNSSATITLILATHKHSLLIVNCNVAVDSMDTGNGNSNNSNSNTSVTIVQDVNLQTLTFDGIGIAESLLLFNNGKFLHVGLRGGMLLIFEMMSNGNSASMAMNQALKLNTYSHHLRLASTVPVLVKKLGTMPVKLFRRRGTIENNDKNGYIIAQSNIPWIVQQVVANTSNSNTTTTSHNDFDIVPVDLKQSACLSPVRLDPSDNDGNDDNGTEESTHLISITRDSTMQIVHLALDEDKYSEKTLITKCKVPYVCSLVYFGVFN